jgi:hypothetical protein
LKGKGINISKFTRNIEGILEISGRMLLWNEHGIEAPESGFDVGRRRHFSETGRQLNQSKADAR